MKTIIMDRYDPFESMDRMFEQMRRTMMDARRRPMALPDGSTELAVEGEGDLGMGTARDFGTTVGNVRLEPVEDGFVAMADLPGFEIEEITVTFDDGMLSVEAVHETSEEDETAVRRGTRRFSETIRVPGTVDVDAIEGSYRNGVLELTLPTTEEADDARVIDLE